MKVETVKLCNGAVLRRITLAFPHGTVLQNFSWSSCSDWSVGLRVPFVVDVCPMTFEQLDLLLRQVSEGMDGSSDWPPPQEKECMVVATLNLLRLQVRHHHPRPPPAKVAPQPWCP